MQTNGAQVRPGTALLIAAAPTGKGKLTEASSVIPVLAAVPPAALAGTVAATLIELADPTDPQAVLTRVRGAATTEGPLTVVLVGQLQLDRRQRVVHLALARTTPSTIRYTALPWAWLVQELQQRRPDTTVLFVDLVADAEVWQLLDEEPLSLPGGARTYGVVAPPPGRRRIAHPAYTHALAQILRTGQRPDADRLHHEILRRTVAVEGTLVLGPEQPTGTVNTQLPPASSAPAVPAPAQPQAPAAQMTPAPPAGPGAFQLPPPPTFAHTHAPALPAQVRPTSSAPAQVPPPPRAQREVSPVYVPSPDVPVQADPHERIAALAQAGRHQEATALAVAAEQHAVRTFGADTFAAVHWIEVRAHLASVANDPGQSGALWLQAAQTRLDTLQQAPDSNDVESAVDRAHYQWDRIRDAAHARHLAPQLVALRRRVPGRQRAALDAIQKKVERLNRLPTM
ncbi:hypothetical protein PV735_46830 [Streptomyces turgidiscabies]|uniref:Uncharacterized protein n=1 Tax=Streptomyces turgidiscabies (strain Car8) TaxID=698760 RepID=L7ETT9_STRT8|nr:hypothetical protein [Streptomyces turgidiscabies]ELP62437.1 hypothetical protein STRTUCAR8_00006 [Streptomyces turgidiscabies Car8]MDX3500136.1 hypothetical protein [Streptomyces turgidiscabies]GAQ77167.1 hypothetical protein T45_08983 [Streptomyces turgidiscabies]